MRQQITGFSASSRRLLLQLLNQIDKSKFEGLTNMFLGLTLPGGSEWCGCCPKRAKAMLRAFCKRHRRQFGPISIIWKLEPQKRGAPHFHLMIFGLPATLRIVDYRRWVADAWWDVVGSGEESHRRSGTSATRMKSWGGVTWYAAKYIGKEVVSSWVDPGRFWGVESRELLPIVVREEEVEVRQAVQVKRALRRWEERKPVGSRYTVVASSGVKCRTVIKPDEAERLRALGVQVYPTRRRRVRREAEFVGINSRLPCSDFRRLLRFIGVQFKEAS